MKTSFTWFFRLARQMRAVCLAAGLLGLVVQPVSAVVLITVDVSNPSAVVFTATGNHPVHNDASTKDSQGITLHGFFTAPVSGTAPSYMGHLIANHDPVAYPGAEPYDSAEGNADELALYHHAGTLIQDFSTSSPAFYNSSTIDLSAFASQLPSPGTSGKIEPGSFFGGYGGVAIGLWTAVPEVSTYAQAGVMVLALTGWLLWHRRPARRQ